MKIFIYFLGALLFISISTYAQVSINNNNLVDESAMLHIEATDAGLLIPRMSSAAILGISNPAKGLVIYDTDTNSMQYNNGTAISPNWGTINTQTAVFSKTSQSAKYSNTNTTTNINTLNGRVLPIFGTELWNDNSSLFEQSGNALVVRESGRYKINVNVSIASNSGAVRKSPEMYITINNTQVGAFASTGMMRIDSGHEESSLHLNEVLELNVNNVIRVFIIRTGAGNTATMRSVGSSTFSIEKVN